MAHEQTLYQLSVLVMAILSILPGFLSVFHDPAKWQESV